MKFRLCPWGDINTGTSWWGIQAQAAKGEKYLHCSLDGKALVFAKKSEAMLKLIELRVADHILTANPALLPTERSA